ncbi:MAG TPA: cation-translocating P-type ATPase [Steroidobacteraceae bacterium]|nr:cation-translocating P-type ATPase [Steroidobacteraceae bacterium]
MRGELTLRPAGRTHLPETGESGSPASFRARIAGMDCGSCALTIEDGLRQLPGAQRVTVDFTTETLDIEGAVSRESVAQRLRQLGYRLADGPALEVTDVIARAAPVSGGFLRFFAGDPQQRRALIAALAVLLVSLAAGVGPGLLLVRLRLLILAATVVVVGAPIFMKGLRALVFSHRINIDLLMTLAALGALLIGEAAEAATVVLLFTFGEGLERFSAARARDSLRTLMALQPQTATLLQPHTAEHEHEHEHDEAEGHATSAHVHMSTVPVAQLLPGDVILIKPGERVAADGVVVRGESSVDQAAVTGESIPVPRGAGDAVLAGTVNADGALEVQVTRVAAESTVARIARLVTQAQAQRSPAERFIDRFARWYTPAVVLLAVLVVALPVLFWGAPLLTAVDGTRGWLYRGLALLIIACPCALVISIPVTVVSSLTRLARSGVLVKGGEQLDQLAEVRTIAFDKTGTLTRGRPSVTAVQSRGCAHEPLPETGCASCDDVIALAASVERSSEHPIAHAIMESAQRRGLVHRYPPAAAVVAAAGRGVTGQLQGSAVAVGTPAMMRARGATLGASDFAGLDASRRTVMLVARDAAVVGAIGVEDALRNETPAVLAALRDTVPGLHTAMLTGDNEGVARAVAQQLGAVDEVHAGLLPADKLSAIEQLRHEHGPVAMVGDGINDAPALARADVGIAMGGAGSAQAMETADVVLMQDDLTRLPATLAIARHNRVIVRQNIALSLGLKLAFLALAIPGLATLWLAVLADVGTTVLVTLNGMRMLKAFSQARP